MRLIGAYCTTHQDHLVGSCFAAIDIDLVSLSPACSLHTPPAQASRRVYSRWHAKGKPPPRPSALFPSCRASCTVFDPFFYGCACLVSLARCFGLHLGQLVDEARKQERLLWYTSMHPDTPLHTSLPLNTAVALPISLSVLRRDLCFVFFAEHDVNVSVAKKHLSKPEVT